ncbi:MAG: dienelactone hydrolase family protein [Acidimicrobiia bacterium]
MAVLEHEGTYSIMYGAFGFPVGAGYRPGYLARPDKAGRFPVVMIVPDIDGLTSHEKDLCRRFARHGLAAVSLELYRDRTGEPLDDYAALSDRRAVTDLDELHEFLVSDDVDWAHADAVGLLGLDVGGRFAMAQAANRGWARSLAVCYTPLTGDEEREIHVVDLLDHLAVPVMGIYAAEDELIETGTVDEAQRRNEPGQWLLYEGARHGFMNINRDGYDADAAADAESRLIQFFLQTLPAAAELDLG